MKKKISLLLMVGLLLVTLLFGCNPSKEGSKGNEKVTVTDHAQRMVEIPNASALKKVYFTSPIGMIMVYTVAPEKMAGVSMKLFRKRIEISQSRNGSATNAWRYADGV